MSYPYPVEEIANYHADMADLLASIRANAQDDFTAGELTAPHAKTVDGVPNPYFERENWAGSMEHYTTYDYVAFRADIEELAGRLERFVDDTRLEHFDEINADLLAIKNLLEEAQSADSGMESVDDALAGWLAGAAVNFRDVVVYPFGRILLRQANLAKELATAALSYKAIVEHARADSLSLTSQLDKKLDLSGGGFGISLDQVLFAAGAVASGVALVTGGPVAWPAVIAWGASTARGVASISAAEAEDYAVDGIASRAGERRPRSGPSPACRRGSSYRPPGRDPAGVAGGPGPGRPGQGRPQGPSRPAAGGRPGVAGTRAGAGHRG